jgi:hypothetical protein
MRRMAGGADGIQTAMHSAMRSSNRSQREAGLELKTFAVPESQGNAVTEGIEKVVLAVTALSANTKALDLIEQVVT